MRRPPTASRPGLSLTAALALGLLALASCTEEGRDSPTAAPGPDLSAAQAAPGLQDFGPAIAAAQRYTPGLMARPGVVGTAVGLNPAGQPVVKVFLTSGDVRGIPEQLDQVPVVREVTGRFELRTDRTARARPAPIGFSVGHPNITAGTLGARVTDGTQVFILSNNHVLADNNNASIGDPILQPGAFDGGSQPGDVIGTLYAFEPISFSANNQMDAAIAVVNPADVSGSTPTTEGYGAPGTLTTEALVGMEVQKYGRTTGLTTGTVHAINVTVSVCFETRGPFMCARSATFVEQFTISDGTFSRGGDSGSLIVTDDQARSPVGLLFAGSSTLTIANPIDVVLGRFGVTIDPTVPDGTDPEPDPDPDPEPDPKPDPEPDPEPSDISLSVNGSKVRGLKKADLTWSGATSDRVEIFRNGSLIDTVADTGAYHDAINTRGGGTYTYQVCEAETDTCSARVTITF